MKGKNKDVFLTYFCGKETPCVLATNVALAARASLIGLNGLSNVPSGDALNEIYKTSGSCFRRKSK